VIAYVGEHLADVPVKHRPRIGNAVAVLHGLCKWARREPGADNPGHWLAGDTVGQLEANTGLPPGTIRDVLAALEHIGLTVTLSNGGGRGLVARGATRRLVLDPVAGGETPRANPAQYAPKLRGLARDRSTETPRANPRNSAGYDRNSAGQARDTASYACTTYPRAGDAGDASTAPAVEQARPLRPTDVLRCPNLPARRNAWCHATCELCHGMGHIYAEQLNGRS
jgi:hypothetical protein